MDFTHGTDIGPICLGCNGTIWGYTATRVSSEESRVAPECVGCGKRPRSFVVRCFDGMPTVKELRAEHFFAELAHMEYFTVLVPYTDDKPTKWHPTESTGPFAVLTRGAFETPSQAQKWADANLLPHHAYSIRKVGV